MLQSGRFIGSRRVISREVALLAIVGAFFMSMPSGVVFVVDRLSQGFLGPYGNTVVRTPEFDALAAESFVFDQALIADPQLGPTYDALWTPGAGSDPAVSRSGGEASLIAALNAAGIATCLVTDEPRVAEHPRASDFAERLVVAPRGAEDAAADIADTGLAQLIFTASEWLRSARRPFLLWIHAQGMAAPWDAPYSLREQYVDEEDPPAPQFTAVPDLSLAKDYDPDQLLGLTQAYLGQVSLVDTCLGVLRETLTEMGAADVLFCCTASRGFPLGEHRYVGGQAPPLFGELLQIPLLLRLPQGVGAMGRSAALVQVSDLAATLLACWSLPAELALKGSHNLTPIVRDEATGVRQAILFRSQTGEQAIRTPAWSMRASGPPEARRLELFAKPSDRWEVNEVANRAPQIAEHLAALLAATPSDDAVPPILDRALVEPLD